MPALWRGVSTAGVSLLAAAGLAACGGHPAPTGAQPAPSGAPSTSAATISASASPAPRSARPSSGAAAVDRAAAPCGWRAVPPARYGSIVWIWLENRSYGQVAGSSSMPYLSALTRKCGLASDYHNVTHPSLPNYLAAVSGTTGGVTSDCDPASCPQSAPTLFAQVAAQHLRWATYAEGMPSRCDRTADGRYAPKHNAAVYYPAIRTACQGTDVPMGTQTSGALASALAAGMLPSFTMLVPDLCNDGHDCSNAIVDRWLAGWLPRLLDSSQYRSGRMAVVVTWDEGSGGSHGESCTTSSDPSCLVATVVVSPSTRHGTVSSARFSHFSLLRTTEEMLGLVGRLGQAAGWPSMRHAFVL